MEPVVEKSLSLNCPNGPQFLNASKKELADENACTDTFSQTGTTIGTSFRAHTDTNESTRYCLHNYLLFIHNLFFAELLIIIYLNHYLHILNKVYLKNILVRF